MGKQERRFCSEIGCDDILYSFRQKEIACFQNGSLQVLTNNGQLWKVDCPAWTNGFTYPCTNGHNFDEAYLYAKKEFDRRFHNNGQCLRHLETMAFLTANWSSLVFHLLPLSMIESGKVFCFPEVAYNYQNNGDSKFFSADCIAGAGKHCLYVVEIGTIGKDKQLKGEVECLRRIYPGLPILGILAYYGTSSKRENRILRLKMLSETLVF